MEKCVFIEYSAGYKGWKFYNPTTRKLVISERADFDERYYSGLKRAHSSSPPLLLSLMPSSLSISHQRSSGFIDHSAVSEDDQVTPATYPGWEKLMIGQSKPAGCISDPPAAAAVPSRCPQDVLNFILPQAVQPLPPAHAR